MEAFCIEHCKPIYVFGLQLQMLNDSDSKQVLKHKLFSDYLVTGSLREKANYQNKWFCRGTLLDSNWLQYNYS